ncbi:MAG: hypothetical protein NUV93_04590 [Firmicutes bacterium]|nr:hypothetical protein [Bacillota bacterium]
MADGEESGIGGVVRFLDSEAGRNLDPLSLVCVLGMVNILGIVSLLQSGGAKQASQQAEGARKPPEANLLAQTLSSLMSGHGGQKINPGALVGLLNMLSGHPGPARQEQKAAEETPAPAARLEARSDSRRAGGEPGEREQRGTTQR